MKEKEKDKKSDLLSITAVTPETALPADSFPQSERAAEPPPNPAIPESELGPQRTQTESQTSLENAKEEVKNHPPASAFLVVQLDQKDISSDQDASLRMPVQQFLCNLSEKGVP